MARPFFLNLVAYWHERRELARSVTWPSIEGTLLDLQWVCDQGVRGGKICHPQVEYAFKIPAVRLTPQGIINDPSVLERRIPHGLTKQLWLPTANIVPGMVLVLFGLWWLRKHPAPRGSIG